MSLIGLQIAVHSSPEVARIDGVTMVVIHLILVALVSLGP